MEGKEARPKPLQHYFGDDPIPPARSRQMSRIRGRDTGPELALRRALWKAGARFRVNVRDLPGRPDIASKKAKVAVFVDGCFWHGCPEHYRVPTTRRAYWEEKVKRNQARRTEVLQEYGGWTVVERFECQLKAGLDEAVRAVAKALRR